MMACREPWARFRTLIGQGEAWDGRCTIRRRLHCARCLGGPAGGTSASAIAVVIAAPRAVGQCSCDPEAPSPLQRAQATQRSRML